MCGTASLIPRGRREIIPHPQEVRVTGLPRSPKSEGDACSGQVISAGFSFNGQVIHLRGSNSETYLTTLYGRFQGDERYSLLFAASKDGLNWSVRSILAGQECVLPGGEGPCEAALAYLKDGRVICVFRTDGSITNVYDTASETSATPYGVVYSADDGLTWTVPEPLNRPVRYDTTEPASRLPGSVQPSLAMLPGGTLILSGGRPGLFLWFSRDGSGQKWIEVDLLAHHNKHCGPGETIDSLINTSSYTEVVALTEDDEETNGIRLLVVYDRLPQGWRPIPNNSPEQNSIWLVRATLSPDPA